MNSRTEEQKNRRKKAKENQKVKKEYKEISNYKFPWFHLTAFEN